MWIVVLVLSTIILIVLYYVMEILNKMFTIEEQNDKEDCDIDFSKISEEITK